MPVTEPVYAEAMLLSDRMQEVHRGLLTLGSAIEARNLQSERMHDSIRDEVGRIRHDQKDLEEKLDYVISVMQHDLESLRAGSTDNARSVTELLRVVQELRTPVAEIIALRSRVAGLILGLGVFGSVMMWLAEPIYRWVVEHHFFK